MNVTLGQARIALAILGAVVLALLLNRFVVTDKKRIERTVQEMADAAAKGDVDLLFSHISADYRDETLSRTELKSLATDFLGRFNHVNLKIQRISVNVSDTLARAEVIISGSAESGGYRMPTGTSEWAAEFRKEADGAWRVTSITPERMGGADVSDWRWVRRRLE
jgi:ketosteroid isomerase-like protein